MSLTAAGDQSSFRYGGGAGPDAGVDGFGGDQLAPHGSFSAEDAATFGRGQRGAVRRRVDAIVIGGRLDEVDIIAIGEDGPVALFDRTVIVGIAAPGLYDHGAGDAGLEDLVPADHGLAVLAEDGFDACIEIRLEVHVMFHPVCLHEGLDVGRVLPVFAGVLVAADVKIGIREEGGHFGKQFVQEGIDGFIGRVEDGVEYAKIALQGIGTFDAGQLRIGGKNGRGMCRDYEFRNNADTALCGVADNGADILLGIVLAIGGDLLKAGEDLGFHAKALVVAAVEVEDVEFDGGHAVEGAEDLVYRLEVEGYVEEEAAPGEAGAVVDGYAGPEVACSIGADQLEECFQAADGADIGGCFQLYLVGVDGKGIGFVFVKNKLTRPCYLDQQGSTVGGVFGLDIAELVQKDAGAPAEVVGGSG